MVSHVPYVPPASRIMPSAPFENLISAMGQRVTWMRSHTCPCVFGGSGPGNLNTPGSPVRGCLQCFGVGTYWDQPTLPFKAWISYMHLSTAPDEPGVDMDNSFGVVNRGDPTITIPYTDPEIPVGDPAQPTVVWNNASLMDLFIPVDMLARYTAVLQNGKTVNLPYRQNLSIAPSGAVTIWDPVAETISYPPGYIVDGSSVVLPPEYGYPPDQNYMVEFQCAPVYVSFRHAGGVPHVRPFGGGTVNEPRRFRLQILDLWTRQRMTTQGISAGTDTPAGNFQPFASLTGSAVVGAPVP